MSSGIESYGRLDGTRSPATCQQEKKSEAPASASAPQPAFSAWQLARTPNPAGGPDSITIKKTANATSPAPDIAGLMLRCGEGATTEVLIVLAQPLALRTHPKVTVVAGAVSTELIASVVSPGALVLLPEKASALLEKSWQSVPELAVSIAENHRSMKGVVSIADIGGAMQTLQSNCASAAHSSPAQILDRNRQR